ncbi:MAG TPA: T9SS type A sorting domain-containing protein [Bacteroidales bacterium]|nr:T9SS type A sorting domain-containing protein [Bacteroidales bacterium]
MKQIILSISLLIAAKCMAAPADTIPANSSLIEYTGRIDFSNPLAPKFSYSGVSIRACFTGTSIAAIMNDNIGKNYYNVILDGKVTDTINVSIGQKTYLLAEGLENKVHEIELFKRTEQEFGKTEFLGFVVDKDANLSTIVNQREKMIEFIGNSITCGYGNEGKNGEKFGPTTENHYLTYAAITSRNFNARHLAVCKSGIGIYRNYDGPATGDAECMTNLYTRTFLYDDKPKYSFAQKPDLVCIDLGTNDFSTTGCDSARFINNYFRLIDTIQTKYAMPEIICLAGPMMSGSALVTIKKYLTFIADSATKKGKGKVYFFEMSAQSGDVGIDYHPNVTQHKKNAQELTDFIVKTKGWKITPLAASASLIGAKHIQVVFNTGIQDSTNNFTGIAVAGNNGNVSIDTAFIDTADNKILHILTESSFAIGESVTFSYNQGSIMSIDSIALLTINQYTIQNKLTETKLARGISTTDGKSILLSFNKALKNNNNIEGLTITNSKGILAIDSFAISGTQINLYLKEALIKGDSIFANYNGNAIVGFDDIPLESITKLVVKNASKIVSITNMKNTTVEIFPNPNKTGKIYYRINLTSGNKGTIDIFNINGKLVFSQSISKTEGFIDATNLKKGSYIVKIKQGENSISKTILLQ